MANFVEIASVFVFFIGFYGLLTSKNIIRSIVSTVIIEMAVVLFFLSINYAPGAAPPIGADLTGAVVADPLPQALVITAIIIGITVSAVNVTMLISLCRKERTTDWDIIKKKSSA